jgi:nucleotide-binding universal stress UspA family protein
MFDTILVPLDGSEHSDAVLTQVRRLLLREDAHVHLLGAAVAMLEGGGDRPDDRADHGERHLKLRLEDSKRHLEKLAASLTQDGVRVTWDAVVGDPAATILAYAERERPSLVAMSTHGRSGIRRLIRGSVAERVLRKCPVPLFLANTRRAETTGVRFRKVLVPLDGSERSASILPLVTEFARLHEAEVVLFRVGFVRTPDYSAMEIVTVLDQQQLEESLAPYVEQLRQAGLTVSTRIAFGGPAGEILLAAEEEDVDLVAISTHGHSGLDRWLFGSVAENVLRHCTSPLLVLRTVTPGS